MNIRKMEWKLTYTLAIVVLVVSMMVAVSCYRTGNSGTGQSAGNVTESRVNTAAGEKAAEKAAANTAAAVRVEVRAAAKAAQPAVKKAAMPSPSTRPSTWSVPAPASS